MKTHLKKLLLVAIGAAYILFLLNLNSIILFFVDDEDKFVHDNRAFESNSRVFINFQTLETYDDLLESLYLSGWAFCETENENLDKGFEIILRNETDMYTAHVVAGTRVDVPERFPGKNIASDLSGIEIKASTVGVKDGVYDIDVYVWENEENYGLIHTGRKLIKSKDRFELPVSQQVTQSVSAQISPLVKKSANLTLEDGVLQISGWCFVEGEDTYDQEVLVMAKTSDGEQLYTTVKCSLIDVEETFDNDDYLYSGFNAEIENGEQVKEYAILVGHEGTFLRTEWSDTNFPKRLVAGETPTAGEGRVYASVEATYGEEGELNLGGYAFSDKEENGARKTYEVVLRNGEHAYSAEIPAQGRGDVLKAFAKMELASEKNGISSQLLPEGVEEGIYDILLCVVNDGKRVGMIDTGVKTKKTVSGFEEVAFEAETRELTAQVSPLVRQSSSAALDDGALRVSGWAVTEGEAAYDQQTFVAVKTPSGTRTYTTKRNMRVDAYVKYEDENYLYSGFETKIADYEDIEAYAVCVQHGDVCLCTDWIPVDAQKLIKPASGADGSASEASDP